MGNNAVGGRDSAGTTIQSSSGRSKIGSQGNLVLCLLVGLLFGGCSNQAADPTPELAFGTIPETVSKSSTADVTASLLEGIGPLHLPISTDVPMAQKYFDQAVTLAFGFNHAEAVRSFREAARQDPTCGMCYWRVAFALGPNINAPMAAEAIPEAWAAVQQALAELQLLQSNGRLLTWRRR